MLDMQEFEKRVEGGYYDVEGLSDRDRSSWVKDRTNEIMEGEIGTEAELKSFRAWAEKTALHEWNVLKEAKSRLRNLKDEEFRRDLRQVHGVVSSAVDDEIYAQATTVLDRYSSPRDRREFMNIYGMLVGFSKRLDLLQEKTDMSFESSLKIRCRIKPEYQDLVNIITRKGWAAALSQYPDRPFLQEYAKLPRFDCIPHMPGWDSEMRAEAAAPSFVDGVWSFNAKFKNYDREIQTFMRLIIGEVASEVLSAEYTNDNLDAWVPWEDVKNKLS